MKKRVAGFCTEKELQNLKPGTVLCGAWKGEDYNFSFDESTVRVQNCIVCINQGGKFFGVVGNRGKRFFHLPIKAWVPCKYLGSEFVEGDKVNYCGFFEMEVETVIDGNMWLEDSYSKRVYFVDLRQSFNSSLMPTDLPRRIERCFDACITLLLCWKKCALHKDLGVFIAKSFLWPSRCERVWMEK